MSSFHLLIIALVSATCWNWTNATGLNFTLNLTQLESSSGGGNSAIIGSKVYIHCLTGQQSYSVYVTEDQTAFDNCDTNTNSYVLIGSCQNFVLVVPVQTTKIIFNGIQSYEVGTQYYFTVFETSGGMITSNQPCLNGYKFSFGVIDIPVPVMSSSIAMAPNVMTISSSYIVYDSNTMSSVLSTTYELTSMVTDSTAAGSTSTQAGEIVRPPVTSTSTISTDDVGSRPTTTSRIGGDVRFTTTGRGTVDRTPEAGRTESDEVATYAGIGGGSVVVLIIIVVVVVIILVVVGVIVSRKRNRNRVNSVIYDEVNESQKNSTLKKIIDHNQDNANNIYENDLYTPNTATEVPLNTLSSNGTSGSGSTSPAFSNTEEDSIRTTTSMDPLLNSPPNSPLKLTASPTPGLDSIPEKTDLGSSNNDHQYSNSDVH